MVGQRLSQRRGLGTPDGPFEGVPQHLAHGLLNWFENTFRPYQNRAINEQKLLELAGFMRAPVEPGWRAEIVLHHLMAAAQQDVDYFLDLIDGTLQYVGNKHNAPRLKALLEAGGSVWTVSDSFDSLVSVVSAEVQATYDSATSVGDEASAQLREAWSNAFGRNADPSDAWDHAIKAMEALFIPLVIPKKDKANLGGVVGELRNQGHVWKLIVPGKDHDNSVMPLVGMLDAIWPNVDRHPGQTTNRPPTAPEARAVVTLAATIVQWHRDGWVIQRR